VLCTSDCRMADTYVVVSAQTPLFGFMILQFLAGVLEIQDEDSDVW
jgi:hypothetical protein